MKSLSRGLLFLSLKKKASYGGNLEKSSLSCHQTTHRGKYFSFLCFVGFEKGAQSCCSTQKFHYVGNLYISKPEGNYVAHFFDY